LLQALQECRYARLRTLERIGARTAFAMAAILIVAIVLALL
jgi:hypothetical protein